ncbi:Actin-related protein 2/3 complex subunit 2 [Smittium mucronatum]|uniref:Arp2/3 complex 34 kDa subunit n=1 Tax=Smittium mucronatum TaxID=133383 RepID=A0A1R0H6A1_9FUNG|nr:Actin-related protein 2/3 complex subunit 2 [Smittium mucronatum]
MRLSYREGEYCYLQAEGDRITVIFSTKFKEEMDRVFGRVFLQEFVDARRQSLISNAPQVLYSTKEAPLEIRNFPEQQNTDFNFVTFRCRDAGQDGIANHAVPQLFALSHQMLEGVYPLAVEDTGFRVFEIAGPSQARDGSGSWRQEDG